MNPSAVFFDFDGVLADSVNVKTQAFCALYEPYGEAVVAEVKAYHLAHGGISRFEKFRHWQRNLVKGPDDQATIDRLSAQFGDEVKSRVIASPAIAGSAETLAALHEAGVPMFVVSGTPEDELVDIVAARGLSYFFREVRGAPAKKGAIITDLMRRHDIDGSSAWMIGDAMTDYDAAAETHISFVGIVPHGEPSPFPQDCRVLVDLRGLAEQLLNVGAQAEAWGK